MGITGLINLFKKTSLFLLKCQEQVITMQLNFFLNKNKKFLKNNANGCSVVVNAKNNEKKEQLNNEIKQILKQYKNDSNLLIDYIIKHKTKVYKMSNAKNCLEILGEEPGLIPSYKGYQAFIFNLVVFKKISFKTDTMFILDNKNIDIYYLIQQFHRWYFMNHGFPGFDMKSQILLKQINKGNEDSIIAKLKPNDITNLQNAIARDVESITFVEQYARETAGSKKALEKIKQGTGATI